MKGAPEMNAFSKNLKRFRIARNMTQEQVAEVLGISTQTVSRWECSTTLPDITILPRIAVLYGVTIDDLYKESSIAYDNYAQRLGAVFEASRKPEDFMMAYMEYQKLMKSGEYTAEDLRLYGILHQYMMQVCRDKAEEIFDIVIKKGPAEDPETYWLTYRQKVYFLWETGRNQENIDRFLSFVKAGSNDLQEWICLIQAYTLAEDYDVAWDWLQKAKDKFPENAILHIYAGNLLRSMKQYDEAIFHWKRSLEMEPEWYDSAYSLASCFEEMGDYGNAYEAYLHIADNLERRGFGMEVNWPRMLAKKCQERISG
jgi:transcriptional regulator with XRE-family HTH domain